MGDVLFVKTDPGVSIVCFRVRSRLIQHALDRVRGTGDIVAGLDARERGRDEHHQDRDDRDNDQQFEQRKSATRVYAEIRN